MIKTLNTPLFIICSALFLLHQALQHLLKVKLPLADAYLDNLLAMPVILTLLVAERRHLFRKGADYRLSLLEVILATAYVSAISEWLFPLLSNRFTSDLPDIVFFFAGAGLYYFFQEKNNLSRT
jgi:hypothetical protein